MEKVHCLKRFVFLVMALGLVTTFTSCDDDDEPKPNVPALTDVVGNYAGKMQTTSVSPLAEEGEEPQGTDVSAEVTNENVSFEKFPVADLITAIMGEAAPGIIEAVGDVSYKIGYEPELNTEKDSILFVLDPKPLELNVSIPTETEGGEAQNLHIEVKVSPVDGANYEVETTNLKFKIYVPEVSLGEGDNEPVALPGFVPATFDFELKKN